MESSTPRHAEARKLLETLQEGETEEERDEAKSRLRDLASSWRGFPGQRRRGEPPAGVHVR